MATLGFSLDTTQIEDSSNDFEPIPAGSYQATVTGADLLDTKAGGRRVNVRFDIVGPTHQGRVLFNNYNIVNANPKAEAIGREQLALLGKINGVQHVTDTDQVIGANVEIKVGIRDAGEYGMQNEIKAVKASNSTASAGAPAPAMASAPAVSAPPWAKK